MELAADNPFTEILEDGETILWLGQPDKELCNKDARKVHRFFGVSIIVGLTGIGFTGLSEGEGFLALSSLLGLFAIGLFFATASLPRWQYAVTNRRVIRCILSEEGELVTHLAFHQINLIWLRPKGGCEGSIVFDAKPPFKKMRFDYVADAAEVQEMVVSLLTGARLEEARK